MTQGWMGGLAARPAPEVLERIAPEAAAMLAALVAAVPTALEDEVALARAVCAETLALPPLPPSGAAPEVGETGHHPVLAEVAEQFSLDVTGIDASQRAALTAAYGARTRDLLAAIYVADWVPRVRRALDRLFIPAAAGWDRLAAGRPGGEPWAAVDGFLRAVARLSALDPLTAELVRLRGARQHDCRMCKSLRNASALGAGGDEKMFAAIDHHADSDLSDRHRAALALTDALIWQPGYLPEEAVAGVRAHFSPAEAVELVLDVMRNACNKIAVAAGTDQARVAEGVEVYDLDADGGLVFGAGD